MPRNCFLILQRTGRMNGTKVKILLSIVFLTAGALVYGLLLLRRGQDNYLTNSTQAPIPLSVPGSAQEELPPIIQQITEQSETGWKKYVLQTGDCSIPNVPIWSKALEESWQGFEAPSCATRQGIVSYIQDHVLVIENESSYKFCCYREIKRKEVDENDGYSRSENCEPYKGRTNVGDLEYFLVECHSNSNPAVQYRFHANVPVKPIVKQKIEAWTAVPEKPISVAILVLDSVSRTHAYRSLNKTLPLLLRRLNFIDFKGHHDLGEPTMPNAVPLLLGESSAAEFFQKEKTSWTEHWDKYDFIWKRFSDLNYVTMFAEDDPRMGTFNYGTQRGFRKAPTDYYPRPLLAAHEDGTVASMGKLDSCFGNETITDFMLNYHLKFLRKIHPNPSFSINWLCRPQHDKMEALKSIDDTLSNFFLELGRQKALLENTLLIVASDHGFWSHEYSRTHEGLLERRLPLLLMRVPENLSKRYPQLSGYIQSNSHRITSHHDTYQTLIHIAQLVSGQTKRRKKVLESSEQDYQYSLLEPIPVGRTCEDAHIPAAMCACNLPLPDDTESHVPSQVQIPHEMFHPTFD